MALSDLVEQRCQCEKTAAVRASRSAATLKRTQGVVGFAHPDTSFGGRGLEYDPPPFTVSTSLMESDLLSIEQAHSRKTVRLHDF